MANDRVYLECKTCGTKGLLFKYYPNGNSFFWDPTGDEFLNKHVQCKEGNVLHLAGDPRFRLVAESSFEDDPIGTAKRGILEQIQHGSSR